MPVTVATIAQRLRDDHRVEVSESTVRRYIATAFTEDRLEDRVTVPRGAVEPGSEAQIDYGRLGMWCDPVSGRRVAVWVFAMILSCSRALFVQPVLRMDQTSWNASHVAAFEFFGGVPARLVCDNLKTGVMRPDCMTRGSTWPTVNSPVLRRPDRPRARQKTEGQTSDRATDALHSGLVLRRPRLYLSGPDAGRGTALGHRGLRGHKHRGLDGQTPASVFAAIEAGALMPLPPRAFESVVYGFGRVAPDCHVKSGKALYSVPWRLIGQQVTVRTAGDIVQIFHDDTVWRPTCCTSRTLHELRALPAAQGRLHAAQRELVSHPGRADRARCGRDRRRTLQVNAIHRLRAIQGSSVSGTNTAMTASIQRAPAP